MKRGEKEERILRGEEGARDAIRRASLILESETTGRETEPLIFRHHFSFASILLLPRDGREANGTPARFVDMQGKFFKRRGYHLRQRNPVRVLESRGILYKQVSQVTV